MPLKPGKSKSVISKNISEMVAAGHPQRVAVAASLHNADKYAPGGRLGQMKKMHLTSNPHIDHIPHFGGLFHGNGGGRTDNLNVAVPHNSYVLPADVVSGLGQGNTMSGQKALNGMFPHSASGGKFAKGGVVDKFKQHKMIPIIAASGEYLVHPNDVAAVGKGNIKHGHQILDAFVKHVRKKTVKETAKLPGPKK